MNPNTGRTIEIKSRAVSKSREFLFRKLFWQYHCNNLTVRFLVHIDYLYALVFTTQIFKKVVTNF